jgi:hypothetical protein
MQQKKVHFFEPPPKNKILKKNARALAYVIFLLYLCSRKGFEG